MSLYLLPCEIYHREFDAKLLLSMRLASVLEGKVILGYDKYFNSLIPFLPSCVLLEKVVRPLCGTVGLNQLNLVMDLY